MNAYVGLAILFAITVAIAKIAPHVRIPRWVKWTVCGLAIVWAVKHI
jgi:hypothetical protein